MLATQIILDILVFGQIIVAAAAAYLIYGQLRETRVAQQTAIELSKRDKALAFITRFNSADVVKLRGEAVNCLKQKRLNTDDGKHAAFAYLNFFEEMSLAVLNELANEEICRRYFQPIILHTRTAFEAEILDVNPERYLNIRAVCDRWQQAPEKLPGPNT